MPANTLIQIRRSQSTATPPSLANGEIAYSFSSNKLFIGQTDLATSATSVEWIGGKLVVDKVANLESVVANITDGSFTHADLSVTNSFTISNATNNAVLFAKAGGVIDFVSGSSGKVLQIASNNTPTFNDLDGGSF
jgi:hypothetical protein|tara:strand:- start:677 stop:1084 length:408 start_codon:yes stop_codon:yes gene_type:complete